MPVSLLKRDELCAAQTSNGLGALNTFLGEEIPKAFGAVWLLLSAGKLLSGQGLVAVGASEAVLVPGGALVRDATLVNHPIAFQAALGKVLLIAWHTDDFLVTGDEALVADWLLAHGATETLLMPLLALVLKLLHSSPEDVGTSIAPGSKVVVVAVGTVQLVVPGGERLIHKRVGAIDAFETFLMPMLVLIRQVLGVCSNGRLAFLT